MINCISKIVAMRGVKTCALNSPLIIGISSAKMICSNKAVLISKFTTKVSFVYIYTITINVMGFHCGLTFLKRNIVTGK